MLLSKSGPTDLRPPLLRAAAIDVRPEAHDEYIRKVDAEHEQLIWTHPGMTTYYRNSQGRVFSAMPWRFVDYWAMTHDPDLRDYHQTKV
jgi:4-hydroxyacetophenone monooxygenase